MIKQQQLNSFFTSPGSHGQAIRRKEPGRMSDNSNYATKDDRSRGIQAHLKTIIMLIFCRITRMKEKLTRKNFFLGYVSCSKKYSNNLETLFD